MTTIRNVWFQTHWLLGITAGVVIAVVGVTGGLLSFEHELLHWMNPDVMTVKSSTQPRLSSAEIMARVKTEFPDARIASFNVSTDPNDAVRVGFAPPRGAPAGTRGELRYFDPYTGESLGVARGEAFFQTVTQLHRRLIAGDIGKSIVGASTVALIVLSLSGLYLRWPRRPLDWRSWFKLHTKRQGRSFLWDLHSVIGAWVLIFYLLASFTGLYWSYEWYRDGLFALTGAPRPTQAMRQTPGSNRESREREPQSPPLDVAAFWATFEREAGAYRTANVRLPERPGHPVQITYLDTSPAHSRATNRLVIDPSTQTVMRHERYADKNLPAKLMQSMLALHSGSYFGWIGTVLMMLASFVMPLFAITGWMLYLDRRRSKRETRQVRRWVTPATSTVGAAANELLVGFASQSGSAERLAWQTAGSLQAAGVPVAVHPLGRLDEARLAHFDRALFVVSTFGDGEPPDGARTFARELANNSRTLERLRFGVLALGDRQYPAFCNFGRSLDSTLRHRGAQPLFDPIEVDRGDRVALRDWQKRLRVITGATDVPLWPEPAYGRWQLIERRLLNRGSIGGSTFHIVLKPIDGDALRWQSGDLVEVMPRHAPGRIEGFLREARIDGSAQVKLNGNKLSLAELLARSLLPPISEVHGMSPRLLAQRLQPLSPRQFSIGSLPSDGAIELLVRQVRHTDELGLASGWLTQHAPIGTEIELRIQANDSFRLRDDDRPAIFIGNGTGLAGLRGHLKARAVAGQHRNWLIFGERQEAIDFYHREEIRNWQSSGALVRVDLAFSRDQVERIYVQQRVREAADVLRAWIADGATIYVCGSVEGMAPGVEAALIDGIGRDGLDRLIGEGRYRRDVY